MKPARVHNGSLHTFPGGGQGRNTLSRRFVQGWGLKTRRRAAILPWEREYARIKIDGLRLVGGNPDFTNAPRHGGGDADTTESQRDMLDLTMTNAWSATTTASTRTRHRGTDELSEI